MTPRGAESLDAAMEAEERKRATRVEGIPEPGRKWATGWNSLGESAAPMGAAALRPA